MNNFLHSMNYRGTTVNTENRNPFACHKEAKKINPRAAEKGEGVSLTPPLGIPHRPGEESPLAPRHVIHTPRPVSRAARTLRPEPWPVPPIPHSKRRPRLGRPERGGPGLKVSDWADRQVPRHRPRNQLPPGFGLTATC